MSERSESDGFFIVAVIAVLVLIVWATRSCKHMDRMEVAAHAVPTEIVGPDSPRYPLTPIHPGPSSEPASYWTAVAKSSAKRPRTNGGKP